MKGVYNKGNAHPIKTGRNIIHDKYEIRTVQKIIREEFQFDIL